MASEPWAKFTTRETPKISVSPRESKNKLLALASPFSSCANTV